MLKYFIVHSLIVVGLIFSIQGCSEASAESETPAEKPAQTTCCKLVESAAIWMPTSLCPKESGWVSKGLGVDKHGNWKSLCAKVTLSCSCPAEN